MHKQATLISAVICEDEALPVLLMQEPLTSSSWEVGLGRVLLAAKKEVSSLVQLSHMLLGSLRIRRCFKKILILFVVV